MKRISHFISSRRQGRDNTSSSSADNIISEAAEDDQPPISHRQSTTGIVTTTTDNEATSTNHQPTPSTPKHKNSTQSSIANAQRTTNIVAGDILPPNKEMVYETTATSRHDDVQHRRNTQSATDVSIVNTDMTAGITTSLAKLKSPSKEKPTQDSTKIIKLIGTINDRLNEKRSLYNQAILGGHYTVAAQHEIVINKLEQTKSNLEANINNAHAESTTVKKGTTIVNRSPIKSPQGKPSAKKMKSKQQTTEPMEEEEAGLDVKPPGISRLKSPSLMQPDFGEVGAAPEDIDQTRCERELLRDFAIKQEGISDDQIRRMEDQRMRMEFQPLKSNEQQFFGAESGYGARRGPTSTATSPKQLSTLTTASTSTTNSHRPQQNDTTVQTGTTFTGRSTTTNSTQPHFLNQGDTTLTSHKVVNDVNGTDATEFGQDDIILCADCSTLPDAVSDDDYVEVAMSLADEKKEAADLLRMFNEADHGDGTRAGANTNHSNNNNDNEETNNESWIPSRAYKKLRRDTIEEQYDGWQLVRDECVKVSHSSNIGERLRYSHEESKKVFGKFGILSRNCAIHNRKNPKWGKTLKDGLVVEDLEEYWCCGGRCGVKIKIARVDGGLLVYKKVHLNGQPYKHTYHNDPPNYNDPQITELSMSIQQKEEVLKH